MKTLQHIFLTFAFVACLFTCGQCAAQPCPPISESYLSGTAVKRSKDGLDFQIAYSKSGGQRKESYQAYILAYADISSEKIAKLTPQQAIKDGSATIIHTQISSRDNSGEYQIDFQLDRKKFVEKMLTAKQIAKTDDGGWGWDNEVRLAVFIPFLDDKEYSVLEGLPRDKHECNYRDDSALLFQPISQKLLIQTNIILLNGTRPVNVKTR